MIRVLEQHVISQIAAGEVVERPFSVVKELVENSLDAGAKSIAVELTDGGKTLIHVADDGSGMTREDLALAFVSHATSKLSSLSDLDHIGSLGFRGEALASIGSVSRSRIVSRRRDDPEGAEVRCAGGRIEEVRPAGAPPGTLVEVAELFFNTPARRRFLRTEAAERARCLEHLTRLALANAHARFTLTCDGRETLSLPAGEERRERIARLFGRELASRAHEVSLEVRGVRLTGLAVDPQLARRDGSGEFLFVNGRAIKDRSLSHALREAYREHLMGGRFPVAFLFVEMDPSRVDVNVHPTKSEVRFAEGSLVYALVRNGVAEALRGGVGKAAASGAAPGSPGLAAAEEDAAANENARPRLLAGFPELPAGLFGPAGAVKERPAEWRSTGTLWRGESAREARPISGFPEPLASEVLSAHDLYLVFGTEAGIAIVDQHALHERVLYEDLRAARESGSVRIQRLLVPETVDLSPADKVFLLESAEELSRAGLLVEDFGGSSVSVHGVPALLPNTPPAELLRAFLDGVRSEERSALGGEPLAERFHSMACRAAVMAGDRLAPAQVRELLARAARLDHPHNCPHGRPTVLTLTHAELLRHFKRRV